MIPIDYVASKLNYGKCDNCKARKLITKLPHAMDLEDSVLLTKEEYRELKLRTANSETAHWIQVPRGWNDGYEKCSVCGASESNNYKYCHNCGRLMTNGMWGYEDKKILDKGEN